MTPPTTIAPALKPLSESDIQEALYGEYHADGRRRRRPAESGLSPQARSALQAPAPAAAPVAPQTREESPWTGAEILHSELQQLTRELGMLRREKERLAVEMAQVRPPRPPASPAVIAPALMVLPAPQDTVPDAAPLAPSGGSGGFWMMLVALLLASAGLGVVFHTVVLEAQPFPFGERPGNLYSVQVGVYDLQPPAQRLVDTLSREGHPAFLAVAPTRGGKPRYRVYVGHYPSKIEAQVEFDRLRRHPLLTDSFILQRR